MELVKYANAKYAVKRGVNKMRKGSSPVVVRGAKIGRNDPCPCGSGKKFKRCCNIPGARVQKLA